MRLYLLLPVIAALAAALLLVEPPRSPAEAGDADASEMSPYGMEYQARGEVHEGYAEPTRYDNAETPLVPKEPPANVKEEPPAQKPEGDNVSFIPGYWSWEEEANDFNWNSGFWRNTPPGRTWVPGRWQKAEGGSRWVSGYWAVAGQQQDVEYLPPPPVQTREVGPPEPQPSDNHTYVPGNWVYEGRRYQWRAGYWLEFRTGWVWVPACYKWTPAGFVFIPGYWDVPMLERGLLFAPVRFTKKVYLKPDFVYRPSFCVQPDFLCGALFVRQGASCYHFGNYFEPEYKRKFTPWLKYSPIGGAVDLNFSYYKIAYRKHPAWERNVSSLYSGRFNNSIPRPPRTLVQQFRQVTSLQKSGKVTDLVRGVGLSQRENVSVLAPIKKLPRLNVTALSSLAGISPAAAKGLGVQRQLPVAKLTPQRFQNEKLGLQRFDALTLGRQTTETRLKDRAPANITAPPIRGRIDLPRNTPPPPRVPDLASVPGLPQRPKAEPPLPKPKDPPPGTGGPGAPGRPGGPGGPIGPGGPGEGKEQPGKRPPGGASTTHRPRPPRPDTGGPGDKKPGPIDPSRPPRPGSGGPDKFPKPGEKKPGPIDTKPTRPPGNPDEKGHRPPKGTTPPRPRPNLPPHKPDSTTKLPPGGPLKKPNVVTPGPRPIRPGIDARPKLPTPGLKPRPGTEPPTTIRRPPSSATVRRPPVLPTTPRRTIRTTPPVRPAVAPTRPRVLPSTPTFPTTPRTIRSATLRPPPSFPRVLPSRPRSVTTLPPPARTFRPPVRTHGFAPAPRPRRSAPHVPRSRFEAPRRAPSPMFRPAPRVTRSMPAMRSHRSR